MTEHYTQATYECSAWCNRCGRVTRHSVSGGRRGACLEHQTPIVERKKKGRAANTEPTLFDPKKEDQT